MAAVQGGHRATSCPRGAGWLPDEGAFGSFEWPSEKAGRSVDDKEEAAADAEV